MHFYALLFLFLLSNFYECGKIKMVDEPFSFNAPQNGAARGDASPESNLFLRYIPEKPSGPPYLIENLAGKCFSLFSNNYKYEFCPFNNITQREQTYRWNAFNGILGVWKEWLIDGNNFTSMHLVHGDPCAGNLERETQVNLTCGDENAIVAVSEPSICKYEMIFKTPYACPRDVFFVYPMLSKDGKERWHDIESDHAINVTTEKGYKKNRKNLFIDEGLCIEDLQKKIGFGFVGDNNPNPREQLPTSSGIFAQDIHNINSQFATKQQCDVEYARLLAEVEMLREQLQNVNLMGIQSELVGSPSVPDVLEVQLNPPTQLNISLDDNGKNGKINLMGEKKRDLNKHKKGDLGLHDKNITEGIKALPIRKLEISNVGSKSMLHKITSNSNNNNTNMLSKVKKKLKKKKKGDDGILDERSFPMRNLLGRLEYEANVISRLKVHGRLRDEQRKVSNSN